MFLSLRDYLDSSRFAVFDNIVSLSLLSGHHDPLLLGCLVDHFWQVPMTGDSLHLRMESISIEREGGGSNSKISSEIVPRESSDC